MIESNNYYREEVELEAALALLGSSELADTYADEIRLAEKALSGGDTSLISSAHERLYELAREEFGHALDEEISMRAGIYSTDDDFDFDAFWSEDAIAFRDGFLDEAQF